jgi:APA family basic amino acid/polyamine antiporter
MGTLSLVVGNIIGVGIFTTTGYMANYIQSPVWMLIAWLCGALYAISGALVYGILAEKYPLSGGDYQYLSKSVHPLGGYLFGWAAFFVTYSGSVAALSIAAAYYLNGVIPQFNFEYSILTFSLPLFDFNFTLTKLIAIIFITGFSWINYRGIVLSGTSQIILTSGIFLLLILFSLAGSFAEASDFQLLSSGSGTEQNISGFFVAVIAVLFAYMGWTTAVYVAEEVDQAKSTLPRALIVGVLVVGAIYLWVNIVYLMAIPINKMPDVVNIGTVVAIRLWGSGGQFIISGLILVAVLSSLNSTILSGPRIYMAMGRDGFFLGKTGILHPQYEAPHIAIVWQGIWSLILVLSGSFNELLSFVVFVVVIFSIAAGMISLFIALKMEQKNWLSISGSGFYLLFCLIILVNTLWQRPVEALIGLLLTAVAVPFYFIERKRIKLQAVDN